MNRERLKIKPIVPQIENNVLLSRFVDSKDPFLVSPKRSLYYI